MTCCFLEVLVKSVCVRACEGFLMNGESADRWWVVRVLSQSFDLPLSSLPLSTPATFNFTLTLVSLSLHTL